MSGATAKVERRLARRIIGDAGLEALSEVQDAIRLHTLNIQEQRQQQTDAAVRLDHLERQVESIRILLDPIYSADADRTQTKYDRLISRLEGLSLFGRLRLLWSTK